MPAGLPLLHVTAIPRLAAALLTLLGGAVGQPLQTAQWGSFHGPDGQTRRATSGPPAASSAILKWSFTAGDYVVSSPAIGADGTVYVGSNDGQVYALDGASGALKWNYTTAGFRARVISSPAIGQNDTVYVGTTAGWVYALNGSSGALRWRFGTRDAVYSSPAIGADGTVYIGSNDNNLYALDGSSGALKWQYSTFDVVDCAPSIGADGTVYMGVFNSLVAIDRASGTSHWSATAGAFDPAVGADGTVYMGTRQSRLVAVNGRTGAQLWISQTGGGMNTSPAIGRDGRVYVGTADGKVCAITSTGGGSGPLCMFTTPSGAVITSSPAIGSDGTIYVGSNDFRLYAVNGTTGALMWYFLTGGAVTSSPAIGLDGTVYVGSTDNKLYALGVSPSPSRSRTPSRTSSTTPSMSPTQSATASSTRSRTSTRTSSATSTYSSTPSNTPSISNTPSASLSSSPSTSFSPTTTPSLSLTSTATLTPSSTPTSTATFTGSPTAVPFSVVPSATTVPLVAPLWRGVSGPDGRSRQAQGALVPFASGVLQWQLNIHGGAIASSPIIRGDGTMFVATRAGTLLAVAANGSVQWASNGSVADKLSAPSLGGSLDLVYAAGNNGSVVAMSCLTGQLVWRSPTLDTTAGALTVGVDGNVYVAVVGSVYAFDSSNGAQLWYQTLPSDALVGAPPPMYAAGRVYIASATRLLALSASDGAIMWSTSLAGGALPAMDSDGTLYVSRVGGLSAFGQEGGNYSLLWSWRDDDAQALTAPAVSSNSSMVYVGSRNGSVHAVYTSNGSIAWSFKCNGSVTSAPAIGTDGAVFFGSWGARFYALDGRNGSLKWSYTMSDVVDVPVSIGSGGSVFVGTADGALYAFAPTPLAPVPSVPSGPAPIDADVALYTKVGIVGGCIGGVVVLVGAAFAVFAVRAARVRAQLRTSKAGHEGMEMSSVQQHAATAQSIAPDVTTINPLRSG